MEYLNSWNPGGLVIGGLGFVSIPTPLQMPRDMYNGANRLVVGYCSSGHFSKTLSLVYYLPEVTESPIDVQLI